MKWSALPVTGGLYDQHPQLLDEWEVIFAEKAEHERREEERQQRAQRRPTG